jgi:hypothetical protein
MRDIGQNVLKLSFQAGSNSSPSYFPTFFLVSLIEEACIKNIIIIIIIIMK